MIVLYNPVSSPSKKPVLPMSLLAVGAQLEDRHPYRIVDGNLVDDGLTALIEAIEEDAARIVAMTIMPGPQLADALPVTRELRRRFPQLCIVWGGYFPTMHPQTVLESGCVDFIVRGHNEISFGRLVDSICSGESPATLPGVLSVDAPPSELHSSSPGFVPDVNSLPDFPYHRVDVARYLRPTFMGQRTISHNASYGCPFRCNFCAVVNMVDGRYSAQTAERMASVVATLVERHGADSVEFHDNNFFVGEKRIAQFATNISHLEIGWWAYGRIDTMSQFSDDTFERLRASGLRMVFMGAETGSDEVLARMNKGGRQSVEQVVQLVRRMRSFDIVPELSFVLGNPPDPDKDIDETLGFVRRVKAANPDAEIILYLYSPVPLDGALYRDATDSGFRFPESLDDWASADWVDFAQHRTSELPWLNQSMKQRVSDFQRVMQAAYPTVTDPRLTGTRRFLLSLFGSWRYRLGFYRFPLELRLLNRLLPYQRPEVTGF